MNAPFKHGTLLSEQLRPQTLDDLTLSEATLGSLKRMVERKSIPNLLFYGKPGIGKTSAARILIQALEADAYVVNGSAYGGGSEIVNDIVKVGTTMSLFMKPKVCLVDEADYLLPKAQASLRYHIEAMSGNIRFIFTANDVSKLTDPIRSRFTSICFDVSAKDQADVVERLILNYERKLKKLKISFSKPIVREIVESYFPDLRSIANQFELELL